MIDFYFMLSYRFSQIEKKSKVAGLQLAFYLLFFSLQNVQAEFQKVLILIMSHSHIRRITARASSLPSVCEIIASMEGKRARTKMFVKIIGRKDICKRT